MYTEWLDLSCGAAIDAAGGEPTDAKCGEIAGGIHGNKVQVRMIVRVAHRPLPPFDCHIRCPEDGTVELNIGGCLFHTVQRTDGPPGG